MDDNILRILMAHKGLSIKRKSNHENHSYQFIFNWFEQADEIGYKPFECWAWNIKEKLVQYHGCWCLGSLCHQVISSHGVDFVG